VKRSQVSHIGLDVVLVTSWTVFPPSGWRRPVLGNFSIGNGIVGSFSLCFFLLGPRPFHPRNWPPRGLSTFTFSSSLDFPYQRFESFPLLSTLVTILLYSFVRFGRRNSCSSYCISGWRRGCPRYPKRLVPWLLVPVFFLFDGRFPPFPAFDSSFFLAKAGIVFREIRRHVKSKLRWCLFHDVVDRPSTQS